MALELRYLREPAGFADQIRALASGIKSADGFAAFDEQTLLNLDLQGAAEYLLLVDTDADPSRPEGTLVGAAIRDTRNGSVELAIAPDRRRHGLGRRLLREARDRFAGSSLWAHGTLPQAQVLAESEGLSTERSLLVMSRPLVGVVDPPDLENAIANWSIAPIRPDTDLEAFTELNAAAFADHPEQGQLTIEDMKQRFDQEWFDPELLLLVRPKKIDQPDDIADGASMSASVATANGLNGGKPLAFLWLKPQSDTLVELYVLGVHPQIQGQGLGGALSNLMLKIMRGHGFQQAILYVDLENEPAVRSYRRAGFDVSETHTQYAI